MQPKQQTTAVPVFQAKPSVSDQLEVSSDSLADQVKSGQRTLKFVAYPWGVEMEVCDWT